MSDDNSNIGLRMSECSRRMMQVKMASQGNMGHYGSRIGFVGVAKGKRDGLKVKGEVLGRCFDAVVDLEITLREGSHSVFCCDLKTVLEDFGQETRQ